MLQYETKNNLAHHWSDAGMKIRQIETDILYADAWDVLPCRYTYEESDEPIYTEPEVQELPEPDPDQISDAEALNIITGGDDDEEI